MIEEAFEDGGVVVDVPAAVFDPVDVEVEMEGFVFPATVGRGLELVVRFIDNKS